MNVFLALVSLLPRITHGNAVQIPPTDYMNNRRQDESVKHLTTNAQTCFGEISQTGRFNGHRFVGEIQKGLHQRVRML
jgi:hypothetical protein